MGELILVRHGETEWSLSGRHTSYTDLPLTAHGEEQARAVAPLLADRPIGLALVSPLQRAVHTAELAGFKNGRITPDLHEWDYGGYEGITTVEIHRGRPDWNLWTDGVAPGPADHPGEPGRGRRAGRPGAGRGRGRLARGRRGRRPDRPLPLPARPDRPLPRSARFGGALFVLDTGAVSRLGREHDRPVITAWNTVLQHTAN